MNGLQKLAELAGISSSYVDKSGITHYTTDDIRLFFLKAMGYDIKDEADILRKISELEKLPILPQVIAFYDNEKAEFCLNAEGLFSVCLQNEEGITVWQAQIRGQEKFTIDNLKIGYYRLLLQKGSQKSESLLIYAPHKAWQPEFLQKKQHISGTSLMLYALRSENSMGIGDFGDLAEIVKATAAAGGDVVGINPLGVMSPYTMNSEHLPNLQGNLVSADVSPYRSLSRLFINYAYLDLRQIAEFSYEEVQKSVDYTEINKLNQSEYVNYPQVLELKLKLLTVMFEIFSQTPLSKRYKDFENYCTAKGEELENLALFETLLETLSPNDYWRNWPLDYNDIASESISVFKKQYQKRINFYKYCHWLADIQIKQVQNLAISLGMKIGLYTDMPIGAASNGTEVWENPQAYVLAADIGAPADPMRPKGQSWGFNPYHPQQLEKQHYQPFIHLVRENMQYSGALRIDHAMGLQRLFWGYFSKDNPVVQGAYVYYDIKKLTAILTLESVRAKCLLIGEDLGTVPDGFREYMAEHGLLSYKVMARQKEKDGTFITPEKYQYLSLAQFSTHDQATALGFWLNEDIEVFKRCGLYVNDEQYAENLNGRRRDRFNMIQAFNNEGLLSADDLQQMQKSAELGNFIPQRIMLTSNTYVAKTQSALSLIRLCDICGQIKLDNAPGTVSAYPNWRLKLPLSVNELINSDSFVKTLNILAEARPK